MFLPLLGAINSQSFPEVLSPEEEEKYLNAWKNKDLNAFITLDKENAIKKAIELEEKDDFSFWK